MLGFVEISEVDSNDRTAGRRCPPPPPPDILLPEILHLIELHTYLYCFKFCSNKCYKTIQLSKLQKLIFNTNPSLSQLALN